MLLNLTRFEKNLFAFFDVLPEKSNNDIISSRRNMDGQSMRKLDDFDCKRLLRQQPGNCCTYYCKQQRCCPASAGSTGGYCRSMDSGPEDEDMRG